MDGPKDGPEDLYGKGWSQTTRVRKMMKWIEKWVKSQGQMWEGPEMETNDRVVEEELVQ